MGISHSVLNISLILSITKNKTLLKSWNWVRTETLEAEGESHERELLNVIYMFNRYKRKSNISYKNMLSIQLSQAIRNIFLNLMKSMNSETYNLVVKCSIDLIITTIHPMVLKIYISTIILQTMWLELVLNFQILRIKYWKYYTWEHKNYVSYMFCFIVFLSKFY